MKTQPTDEIMAEVHEVKDALSRAAGFDVARLIAASRYRSASKEAPVAPSKVKKPTPKVRRRKSMIHLGKFSKL